MTLYAYFFRNGRCCMKHTVQPDGIDRIKELTERDKVDLVVSSDDLEGIDYILRGGVMVYSPLQSRDTNYVENRQAAYPSYGEQFDMLWHAMNSGQTPKVEPFYSQIKRIKDQFPKS